MKLQQAWYNTIEVPDTDKAELRTFNGVRYLILNRSHWIEFRQSVFIDFCRKTSYHNVYDMYPDEMRIEAVHSPESYLAFMYECQGDWKSVDELEQWIAKQREFIEFVKHG